MINDDKKIEPLPEEPETIDIDRDMMNNEDYSSFVEIIKNNMDPSGNTVLIVDDEIGIRRKVARDVRNFDPGIAIHEAVNGKEALDKLAEIRTTHYRDPILIVLDLNMPIMDGWTFIEKMKKDYEDNGKTAGIPILVLSSTSGEKSSFLKKKSIHENQTGYSPLVTIAKESCIDKSNYDAVARKGLSAWLEHFIKG